jgi:hypothetical protein
LFEEESALMDRIQFLRGELAKAGSALPESHPLKKNLSEFDAKVDAVRKQIVATKEGGAITGEERLREHTDQLYGAILSYEGKPADYQLAYIDALQREVTDVTNEFAGVVEKDLPALNEALKANSQPIISPPPQKVAIDEADQQFAGGGAYRSGDPDAVATGIGLPADFRILH